MKVLFTADWHIKLGQKNVPIDWQINRYRSLFNQIALLAKECDLLIIAGDIFDRVPSMQELSLYFELLNYISTISTIIIPGNHEAIKKTSTFLSSLQAITGYATDGKVQIKDTCFSVENIDFIPYNKLFTVWPELPGNILVTHVRAEIPPHVKAEIDLDVFNKWDIVFAGDLHSHSNTQRNIVYPGSPLTTSFHRNLVDTGVILFDSVTLDWEFKKLDLPQLIRKTVTKQEDMVSSTYHHTIYELEGDIGQLAGISNTDLLDRKIVRREHIATLDLKDLTIQEELHLYLRDILKVDNIEEVLLEANDFIKNPEVE